MLHESKVTFMVSFEFISGSHLKLVMTCGKNNYTISNRFSIILVNSSDKYYQTTVRTLLSFHALPAWPSVCGMFVK